MIGPMRVDELLDHLRSGPLHEIYVPGYLDDGDGRVSLPTSARCFHPMADTVYLDFGGSLIRCAAFDRRSGGMRLERAPSIVCAFEVDPDDTFAVMPLLRFALQTGRDAAKARRLEVHASEADEDECVFAAMGVAFDGDDYVFLDPLDFEGIHVGGKRARDLWISRFGARYLARSFVIGDAGAPSPAP